MGWLKRVPWRRVLSHSVPALILLVNDLTNAVRGINNPTFTAIALVVAPMVISLLHNYEKPAG